MFDSGKEARRYQELKLMQAAGAIRNLRWQVTFDCMVVSGSIRTFKIGEYRCDFTYQQNGGQVVEDVKSAGTRTALYRWKKKHVEAQYGISIREV